MAGTILGSNANRRPGPRGPRGASGRRGSSAAGREKHYVQHDYHDHYRDPIHHDASSAADDSKAGGKRRKGHRGGVAVPFPEKLHYMLSCVDGEGLSDIVRWQPHGRCFMVHKPKEFLEAVMPKFFRQSKLTSFQRQLNLYGFSRLTTGPDRGGYYHELFIRGRMDLCKRMVRTRVKGNGCKAASSPNTEPNFYNMEPCVESPDFPQYSEAARYLGIQADPVSSASVDSKANDREECSPSPSPLPAMLDATAVFQDSPYYRESQQQQQQQLEYHQYPPHQHHHYHEVVSASDESDLDHSRQTRARSESLNGSVNQTMPMSINVVSPSNMPRTCVSHMEPTQSAPSLSIPTEISFTDGIPFIEDENGAHSGDKIFFEGLPFHYLETKDLETGGLLAER